MRVLLRLFPRDWRTRYGDDFTDQLRADPRRVTKWCDTLVTAAGMRWRDFRASRDGMTIGLVGALAVTLLADAALGVGMDERLDATLLHHWWAAPFVLALAAGAACGVASFAALLGTRHRRRSLLISAAVIAFASAAGSALFASFSFGLAGLGAGAGFGIGVAVARMLARVRLEAGDALLLAAVAMIVVLGWRSASSPWGPVSLVIVAAAIVATRARPHASVV